MLNVYLDTNVLSQLSNGLYPEEKAEIERLKSAGKIHIHLTPNNVLELVCMVRNEQKFTECRDILRFGLHLSSESILRDNWRHMQWSVAVFLGVTRPSPEIDWRATAVSIVSAESYGKVKEDMDSLRDYLRGYKRYWHEGASSTGSRIKELFNLERQPSPQHPIVKLTSEEWVTDLTTSDLWDACKIHHRLPDYAERLDYLTAYNEVPAVRYFTDLQRAYHDKMWKVWKKPDESDYFDLEYVIYLDIMDYFLTNDKDNLKPLYDSASVEIAEGCVVLENAHQFDSLRPRAPYRHKLTQARY